MTTHISGRGVTVGAAVRRRVETKVEKFSRFLPKITETRVVLERERYRHVAEVTLQVKGTTLRAEASAADFHAAVDLALESLEGQVRRRKERITARKPRRYERQAGAGGPPPLGARTGEGAEGDLPLTVRRISAKPMSVEEALEQMRVQADGFLVFTNARSRAVNVLRRRADGGLELVQPGG